jgi:hypothetical protein
MQEKVLLCGEGPTDYGTKEYTTGKWQEGPVQPIVRKTAEKPILFEHVEKVEVKKLRIQRGPKGGQAVKSYKLCVIAGKRKISKIICYVDADKTSGKKSSKEAAAREAFQKVYNQVQEGFERFNENFSSDKNEICGIPMVPLRMIESWLLADEEAFVKCFGNAPSRPRLPAKPELIWGKKVDPQSNHPKNIMARILKQFHGKEVNRETFREIADRINIDTLRKRCPISFETFYSDIRRCMDVFC